MLLSELPASEISSFIDYYEKNVYPDIGCQPAEDELYRKAIGALMGEMKRRAELIIANVPQ